MLKNEIVYFFERPFQTAVQKTLWSELNNGIAQTYLALSKYNPSSMLWANLKDNFQACRRIQNWGCASEAGPGGGHECYTFTKFTK